MRKIRFTLALLPLAVVVTAIAPACSLGEGKGNVTGVLNVPDCWTGAFDLKPDFFAAIPYRKTSLIIRIQNGGDYENFSDGISILVDDIGLIRGLIDKAKKAGTDLPKFKVALPPEVTPPGVPITPDPDPARVHFSLFLQRSCRTQVDALFAVDRVRLDLADQCEDDSADAGASIAERCGTFGLVSDAGPDASSITPPPPALPDHLGQSWIRFNSLSNGDPDETDATNRLNDADFDIYLADPREVCPGGGAIPGARAPRCHGHVTGHFTFYFQRGKPAQPFP